MPRRSKAKLGIVAATLCLAMGAFAACADLPTASGEQNDYHCIWIDGILHCAPG